MIRNQTRLRSRVSGLNILPEEYRRRYLSRTELFLGALFLVGLVALGISVPALSAGRDVTASLREQQKRLVAANNALVPSLQQTQQLRKDISNLQAIMAQNRQAREVALGARLDWQTLLASVLVEPPNRIELTGIEKAPARQLFVSGIAHGGFALIDQYYKQLSATPGVTKVTMDRVDGGEDKDKNALLQFRMILTLVKD